MLHLPRFARMFIIVLAVVTIPALIFFYHNQPPDEYDIASDMLDKGGIDSEHWREPQDPVAPGAGHAKFGDAPVFEDEEVRAAQPVKMGDSAVGGGKVQDDVKADGANTAHAGDAPEPAKPPPPVDAVAPAAPVAPPPSAGGEADSLDIPGADVIGGGVIMPHLGNATAKAELGRAAWRVLHLMTLRYPEKPSEDDRQTLKSFFHLFSRLYPCGECAAHFQKLLKKFPPQTGSRKSASLWLCHLHNLVNERLNKPEFDCMLLDKTYDCGCADNVTSSSGLPTSPTAAPIAA